MMITEQPNLVIDEMWEQRRTEVLKTTLDFLSSQKLSECRYIVHKDFPRCLKSSLKYGCVAKKICKGTKPYGSVLQSQFNKKS